MSVDVKVSQSFQTQDQFVEVSNAPIGGLILSICEIDELGEAYNPRLYLTKQEAIALANMLLNVVDQSK
jgi:hypothetical protein